MERKFTPSKIARGFAAGIALTGVVAQAESPKTVSAHVAEARHGFVLSCAKNDYSAQPGETGIKVPGAANIKGDVRIDGKMYYNGVPTQGNLDILPAGRTYTVDTPFGADITISCPDANFAGQIYDAKTRQVRQFASTIDQGILDELNTGCVEGTGCHSVNMRVAPSSKVETHFTSVPTLAKTITMYGKYVK